MEFRHELVKPNDDLPYRMVVFEGRNGNYNVPKHWHKSVELFFVLEGEINFFLNSVCYSLHSGQFIIVNSNEIHSIECTNQNFIIVLQIPRKIFDDVIKDESLLFQSTCHEADDNMFKLVKRMYDNYDKKEYGYYYGVLGDFYHLLYYMIQNYQLHEIDDSRRKQNHNLEKLSAITKYIEDNFREELTLESVAREFGFTPTYLSRMFQKYAGINYKSFLVNVRLDASYKQLLNTHDSIGSIAIENGFSDNRSFSKAFQRRFGILPNAYRKEHEQTFAKPDIYYMIVPQESKVEPKNESI